MGCEAERQPLGMGTLVLRPARRLPTRARGKRGCRAGARTQRCGCSPREGRGFVLARVFVRNYTQNKYHHQLILHVGAYACKRTQTHAHARIRMHTHAYARIRTHTHAYARPRTHTRTCARIRTHTHANARIRTHTPAYARIRTHTHAYARPRTLRAHTPAYAC